MTCEHLEIDEATPSAALPLEQEKKNADMLRSA
jgi:hypothetical protein